MLYFAYGSNLDWDQFKTRCPSARFICKGVLKDYRFGFTRRSSNRRCGVMDIIKDRGKIVWGVVYHIDELDLGRLDTSEGYNPGRQRNAYQRIERIVYDEGDENKPLTVYTYDVVEKSEDTIPPNQEYKSLIVNGANYWKLPEDYIRQLINISTN